MKRRFAVPLVAPLAVLLATCATSKALTYVALNTQDTGTGSLRQAILNANARIGTDRIDFNIPGPGPFVITLQSGLPPISDLLTIDGSTQPGYATSPVVEIDGSAVFGDGLQLSQFAAGGCTVRALAITGFKGRGIVCDGLGGNVIVGCHIGIDTSGALARGNTGDGISLFNTGNTVGGLTVADRNVISGNGRSGILLYGGVANNNRVRGNYIGLKANGLEPLENLLDGVLVTDGAAGNIIGGSTAGAGNVISGNRLNGVEVYISSGTIIHGNIIGLGKDGMAVVSNAGAGVLISSSRNNSVGGSIAGARNIISGNGLSGVNLNGDGTSGNIIAGNLLGVDGSGILPAGNHGAGILLYGPNVTKTRIGGTTALERNIIAGNSYSGIEVDDSVETSIFGNYIGTDATGLEAIPNAGDGVFLFGAQNSIVGGTTTAHRNVIGANKINGIEIVKDSKGNRVQANYIGVGADGLTPLPNETAGILIQDSQATVVGGAGALANKIAFNGAQGVYIESGSASSVLGNSIFGNGGLGIDLAHPGVLENDPLDADTGANNLQNFPVLTEARILHDRVMIRGSFQSSPSGTFTD